MTNTLAKRLTFRIMAVVLVMMTVITAFVYLSVRGYMQEEAQERYEGVLLRDHEEFRRRLSDVMVAVKNNQYEIQRNIDNPERILEHLKHILQINPTVLTFGVAYQPGFFPDRSRCLELIATRDSVGTTHLRQIEGDSSIYLDCEWYKSGMSKDTADWSKVYFEEDIIPHVTGRRQITTYYVPIRQGSRPIALIGADLSLEFLRYELSDDLQQKIAIFEEGCSQHSYNFVINHDGTYIIHPDEKRILNANFFDEVNSTNTTIDDAVVQSMKRGESGSAMVTIDGVPSWIYYRAVKNMNWMIAIVVPEEVIFHNGRTLNTIIILIMLVGIVVIYFICRRMIKDTTNPVALQQAALERELKIANGIQMAMLPKTFPPYPERSDIDIYASVTPAREVGGDFYDYFLRNERLFFCIGDVSGKGMPAALLMAVMRAMFRSETRRADSAVAIVESMNHNLSEEYTASYFVTMFVGILDLKTGHLDYCNAGHEPPYVSGEPLPVKPNLPVGALSDWHYDGQEAQMQPGDMLFLYTDGLTEAENADKKQLGRQHVVQLVNSYLGDTAQQLVEHMIDEVRRHAGDAEQYDDLTLLAIKWDAIQDTTRLTMSASMDEISIVKPYVERVAQQAGIDAGETKRLRLAVEEAVVNVIHYGEATSITLQSATDKDQLTITIDDDGQPFDPTTASTTDLSIPADQRPPGGMGLILIRNMTDHQSYQRLNGHNILTLTKKIL